MRRCKSEVNLTERDLYSFSTPFRYSGSHNYKDVLTELVNTHSSPYYQTPCSTNDGGGRRMVLGKLPVPVRPTIWMIVGQGPIALVVGAGGGCLDIFTLLYPFSPLSPSLWETARYRLKYCLKGPLNPKQSINQCSTNDG